MGERGVGVGEGKGGNKDKLDCSDRAISSGRGKEGRNPIDLPGGWYYNEGGFRRAGGGFVSGNRMTIFSQHRAEKAGFP